MSAHFCIGAFSQLFHCNRFLGKRFIGLHHQPCAELQDSSESEAENVAVELRKLLDAKQEPFVLRDAIQEKKKPVRRKSCSPLNVNVDGENSTTTTTKASADCINTVRHCPNKIKEVLLQRDDAAMADDEVPAFRRTQRGPPERMLVVPADNFSHSSSPSKKKDARNNRQSFSKKKAMLVDAAVKILEGSNSSGSNNAASASRKLSSAAAVLLQLAEINNGGRKERRGSAVATKAEAGRRFDGSDKAAAKRAMAKRAKKSEGLRRGNPHLALKQDAASALQKLQENGGGCVIRRELDNSQIPEKSRDRHFGDSHRWEQEMHHPSENAQAPGNGERNGVASRSSLLPLKICEDVEMSHVGDVAGAVEFQQSSPVSVLDTLFGEEDASMASDVVDNFEETRQQLLHSVRRFEMLAQMDMEMLMKLAEEEEEEEEEGSVHGVSGMEDGDDSEGWGSHDSSEGYMSDGDLMARFKQGTMEHRPQTTDIRPWPELPEEVRQKCSEELAEAIDGIVKSEVSCSQQRWWGGGDEGLVVGEVERKLEDGIWEMLVKELLVDML